MVKSNRIRSNRTYPKPQSNPNSFEDTYKQLETVVRQLESGNLSLDKSMELFEEGMKLSKSCSEMLRNAELKISNLRDEYGLSPGNAKNDDSTTADSDLASLPW